MHKKHRIGIVGHPPQSELAAHLEAGAVFVDLDVPRPDAPLTLADPHMPRVFCATLRTVVANALSVPLDLIVSGVGECKCDGMRFTVRVLRDLGVGPIVETRNENRRGAGTPISDSAGPLRKRVDAITARICTGVRTEPPPADLAPEVGFWGVPPCDASILDLFPESTKILGWTRAVENDTPADLDVETWVPEGLPVVFFAQSFCQKTVLARFLAAKHGGLFVEADDRASRSVRAKIEAFIQLNSLGGLK